MANDESPDHLPADFIVDMAQGAADPPVHAVVRGWLGDDADPKKWRIYLSLVLDEYIALNKDDVKRVEKLANAPWIIWVELKAQATYFAKASPAKPMAIGGITDGLVAKAARTCPPYVTK